MGVVTYENMVSAAPATRVGHVAAGCAGDSDPDDAPPRRGQRCTGPPPPSLRAPPRPHGARPPQVYTGEGYVPESEAAKRGLKALKLSGTAFRKMLRAGEEIPEWFAFRSVVAALRRAEAGTAAQ